jgi:heptosyltransferase-2
MNRVILIRFSSLGDCILLLPLARYLSERGARITVVTRTAFAGVFAAGSGVERVVAFEPGSGLAGLVRLGRRLRDDDATVIDAHNNWRSRILSGVLGGAAVRFRKYYRRRLGLIIFKRRAELPTMLEQYGRLAEAFGAPARLTPGGLTVPAQAQERARLRIGNDPRGCVAMAPGSRWPMKRWPLPHYIRLARHIVEERGMRVVLVGDDADAKLCEPLVDALGDDVVDATALPDVIDTAAVIARCRAFVGNDSGLMHLAEAVGVPVVGLFGPTVEAFGYYPALPSSRVVERELACRPCSRNGAVPCPRGTQECMTRIGADAVAGALAATLAGPGQRRVVVE